MSSWRLRIEQCLLSFAVFVPTGWMPEMQGQEVSAVGFTKPNVTVDVAFSQPGRVKSLHVLEGHQVSKGDLLATLDEGVLPLTEKIAEVRAADQSATRAAQAKLEALEKRVQELKRLEKSGGASPEEVRRVSTERDVAKSELLKAQAEQQVQALEVQRLQLERELRRLKAPFDGLVTEIEKHPGEYVAVTEPLVMRMVQLNPLVVQFHLPANVSATLNAGDQVSIELELAARSVNASIRRVSKVIDPQSGTALVELELPNQDLEIRAGLKCLWELQHVSGNNTQQSERKSQEGEIAK